MKVLLVFGGQSSEHEVSIMSARNVGTAISQAGYDLQLAYISKNGDWSSVDSFDDIAAGSTFSFDDLSVDVIFPLVHGRGGEDGSIATLGQTLGIPVVGCGVEASTIAWDKDLCKQVLNNHKIAVVPSITLVNNESISYEDAIRRLDSEVLFVKPAREGSSVGVGRAENSDQLAAACDEAFKYDDKIIIEKAIIGRELECAVLGKGSDVKASCVGEITADGFYDYDSKYADSSTASVTIPAANLPVSVVAEIQKTATQAFQIIGGSGLSRVDFFLADDGTLYLNEINTMPGFTNISMYPKLWQNSGLSYSQLIDELINLAR